ncbi:glycoside hydrolase family 38 C-terminal domain-containing protein [Nonomuraea zeae]|uniref:glycoside hydrolase family 38 N-terminal domain-containing protein n=1 Tax=Nonomuraea zeae TaxID=1642303 RepID=UPI001F0D3163|nr:glycoside hydrolase family 38 C-terminal domain-containing protein [Nonomuraea zeae]
MSAESTDLFVGSPDEPHQVLRVTVAEAERRSSLELRGDGVRLAAPVTVPPAAGVLEIPMVVSATPGTTVACLLTLGGEESLEVEVTAEEPGWTMFMVSHFHYDPVWWNTQAAYTSPWELLSADATTRPLYERNAFALVEAHIELALRDPDYRFVLAEVDYLKPFFDTHPERRADLRALMAEGRAELVGGTYNEPNTNLTGAETTIRNLVYGIGYQRDILGGDPRTAWQLDVFGHDPQFPGYLAAAGLTGSAWARGPFHQWGPISKNFRQAKNDAALMQFPSEFEWIAPSGQGVLTHYMPAHYSAGWWMDSAPSLEAAALAVYDLYRSLKPVAATKNILLPVGTDYTPPNKWVTDLHRAWAARYVWPRFVCATPADFLSAVRAGRSSFSPQTRDMNPVYTGKDVSYIDTKQAQRAAEVAALDAERLSAFAAALGLGRYPHTALDKVWRQLAYGAHHDAITGSESDQVYIDLLTGWREAHDLAAAARDAALDALTARISVDERSVVVTNTLPFARDGLVRIPLPAGQTLADPSGAEVPAVSERGTLAFLAREVPSMGWRTYRVVPGSPGGWRQTQAAATPGPVTIANERWQVTTDPAQGGALTSIADRASGQELLTGPGNELRVYHEYPQHPDMGEGPWHLIPTGRAVGSAQAPAASVRTETSPVGRRLIVTGQVGEIAYEQTVTLLTGSDRIDFATRVLDHTGADRLLRVRFPALVEGALPVSDVSGAVVGRGFALPDVDSAEHPWTLDNPANTWFGLSATAKVDLGQAGARALGVAEIVVPTLADAPKARDLVVALARVGVTATTSSAPGTRYGWLDVDSNLPDVRIVLGGPDDNPLAAELLSRADPAYLDAIKSGASRVWVPAARPLPEVWQPSADLRDLRALPALIVSGPIADLVTDLADATIEAVCPLGAERLDDRTVALLTYGLPGFAVDPSGALHLSLMRSCTGWPSGVWLDPPHRTTPDGSGFQLQHWTHEFTYSLAAGPGDWRALQLPAAAQEHITPLHARLVDAAQPGDLPSTHSLLTLTPARDVLLSTLKATGNPHAHGLTSTATPGITGSTAPPAASSAVPLASGSAKPLAADSLAADTAELLTAAAAEPLTGGGAPTLTIRLIESTGLGVEAELASPVLALSDLTHSDLLERPGGPVTSLRLTGSEVATYLVPAAPPAAAPPTAASSPTSHGPAVPAGSATARGSAVTPAPPTGYELGPTTEQAQPVYSRYWLHNKGPAPLGYLPISIALTPGLVTSPEGPFEVEAVLSSHLTDEPHEGLVEVRVPEGWSATPAQRPFRLAPGGHLRFPVTVTPPPSSAETTHGLYFISARTSAGGQSFEDVTTVAFGDAPELPVPGPPPEHHAATRGTKSAESRPTGLAISVVTEALTLCPGDRTSLVLRLTNTTSDEIRGEAQLASPWGTWSLLPQVIQGFTVAAGAAVDVSFPVEAAEDAADGHSWALAKVMWFGRCQYAPAVRLEVTR